ncbi:monosaccharide ABC transporter ATP-binding protein (CUT2 family) [Paramicrobacterium agarici]|uniref:Monosaccharide ABC transporter ATP-binding protein (CUT2 family) n=2 Tax=Paramicrobacterium agarici TaxID=630514 RepID=A0A2A9DVE3_9MICO|nr:monosaccharide ABC transporter ATP-binding protein (CUT2 family) [Microbacterium agarici]
MTMNAAATEREDKASSDQSIIVASGIEKSYGNTRALSGASLEIAPGEIVGLVGHNGAGKSTMTRMLAGREQPDTGRISFAGQDSKVSWDSSEAERSGVRMIYQELALCPDLSAFENAYLSDPRKTSLFSWRRAMEKRLQHTLDTVFPEHGITVLRRADALSMAQRQMVEIARALCTDNLRLLILDEPTESLDSDSAAQLYEYLHSLTDKGVGALLISHRMQEVITHSDRVVVMKDGAVAGTATTDSVTEDELLVMMGGSVRADTGTLNRVASTGGDASDDGTVVSITHGAGAGMKVRTGEIVGLAGLAGQGQELVLRRLWDAGLLRRGVTVPKARAYVPGDRQTSGILPLWNVAENLTIAASKVITRFGIVNARRKRELAEHWVEILRVRGGAHAPITSLSGGNQQKVLIARAFASESELVLLDDPFRGVDVSTKNELYALMKAEAARGRSIVWYSTDNAEMVQCDHVYVFRAGKIVSALDADEISEERIIADSFDDSSGHSS